MPDLNFKIESADAVPHAVAPTLAFKLRVTQELEPGSVPPPIHSVALRCQIRLEPGKRRYSPDEQSRLGELFGEPHRWGRTVRGMLWTHTSLVVPPFTGEAVVDLPVPCTFDFNVATTKYFDALSDGQIPLSFLFSGTIFYAGDGDRGLQVGQISWEKEAEFRLPVEVWRRMMDLYYPNTAWLCIRKDTFDRLQEYKRSRATPSWERAIESLLDEAQERLTP
ncbi:MAG TPA: DUF6084 family protein [Tepidisphaeraceae bacterium]|nr:DUF6084 family protein [Tepidisphaeraceae bacterium]